MFCFFTAVNTVKNMAGKSNAFDLRKVTKGRMVAGLVSSMRKCTPYQSKKYKEILEIYKHLDMSVLGSGVIDPSFCKKKEPVNLKNDDEATRKERCRRKYKEIVKQEKLVRKAARSLAKIEMTKFRKYLARKKGIRATVVSKAEFIELLIDHGKSLPLWIRSMPRQKPPPLCGAVPASPDYTFKKGDLVAALVPDAEEKIWILGEISGYKKKKKKYKVTDVYEDLKCQYRVRKKKIIPLPKMRADPQFHPEALFRVGARVLAVFPRTTCFYPAVVSKRPAGPEDPYQLRFEDFTCPSGYAPATDVLQLYVIRCV